MHLYWSLLYGDYFGFSPTIVHLLCQQTIEQTLSNAMPDLVGRTIVTNLRSATINHNLTDHKIKKGELNA